MPTFSWNDASGAALDDAEALLPDLLQSAHRRVVHACIYDAAEWYDVDYAGYVGELPFYVKLCERFVVAGDVVVELGAGTGRLTLPLARNGRRVHAVEPAASMRERLRDKVARHPELQIVVEDGLAETFGPSSSPPRLILFPFNGLLHISDRPTLDRSLRHIHHRLADDGRFAVDITGPYWETIRRGRIGWGRVDERVHPVSGRRFLTCDRSAYDPASRTMRIDIRYALVDDDVIFQTALTQHMWTTTELLHAVEGAGFVVDEAFGDVDFSAFDEGSPRLLLHAIKR